MSRNDRYDSRSRRYERGGGSENEPAQSGGGGRYAPARGREQEQEDRSGDQRRRRYERQGEAPTRTDAMPWSNPNATGGYGHGYAPQWHGGMPTGANGGFYAPPQAGSAQPTLTPEQIMALIQQQQQQQQQQQPSTPSPYPNRASASVDNFVPVIPRSLMNAARNGPTKRDDRLTADDLQRGKVVLDENGFPVFVPTAAPAQSDEASTTLADNAASSSGAGVLELMEAPKIAPAIEQLAREARRLHISGFPKGTTEEELLDYFNLLLPDVRRLMTQREMETLAKASELEESERRSIPPNANTAVDVIHNIRVNQAKSRDFAFIELSLGDIVTEMLEQLTADTDRFQFPAADGHAYSLQMKRPRDYENLPGVDECKAVMIGFPPALSEAMLRKVAEQHGAVDKFQVKDGFAYMEFNTLQGALAFRTAMHGQVLASRMVVALPLYDWLKVLCHQMEIDVTIDEDDPISGQAMLKRLAGASDADAVPSSSSDGAATGTTSSNALVTVSGAGGSGSALVLSAEARQIDHMRELIGMQTSIPIAVFHLWQSYPHLRPLYGNQQVAVFPTRILVLLNLFDEEELTYDDTYSRLVADIEEEVETYGRVVELIVPRRRARPQAPPLPARGSFDTQEEEDAAMADYEEKKLAFNVAFDEFMTKLSHPVYGAFGSVFVEYQTVDEAAHAQQQIAGKLFSGRTVVTSFLFEDVLYEEKEEEKEVEEEGESESVDKVDAETKSGEDEVVETTKAAEGEEAANVEVSVDDLLEGLD